MRVAHAASSRSTTARPARIGRQRLSQDVFCGIQAAGRDITVADLAEEGWIGETQAEGLRKCPIGLLKPVLSRRMMQRKSSSISLGYV